MRNPSLEQEQAGRPMDRRSWLRLLLGAGLCGGGLTWLALRHARRCPGCERSCRLPVSRCPIWGIRLANGGMP